LLLPAGSVALLAFSVADVARTQQLFVATSYYFLMGLLLCWVGTYASAARELRRELVLAWVKENWPGLLVAFAVTLVTALAVEPALRMLSDEANLVGTSKNLFASKEPTFTVSGKYYYDSYWDVEVAIDRRPTLFPFLVSLVHSAFGYSYRNVFLFNLLVLPAFLLVSYRLAKSLGGETFGVVASLLAAAHPVTLLCVRSGGFDFLATFFGLLSLKSFYDYACQQSAGRLAVLWINLCMFAGIRYESALFIVPVVALLLVFKMLSGAYCARTRSCTRRHRRSSCPVFGSRSHSETCPSRIPEPSPSASITSSTTAASTSSPSFRPSDPFRSIPRS